MSTVLGVTCAGGVVLVGDRTVATDGTVTSRSRRHVFDHGDVGVAVVARDVQGFADRLDADLRDYRMDDDEVGIDPLSRIADDLADEFDATVLATARDDAGSPVLRAITPGGGVTDDDLAAFGSGASIALGALESGHDPDATLDDAETLATDALAAAAERDAGTGTTVDSYRLPA